MCQPKNQVYTKKQFYADFPDDDTCLKHLFDLRFKGKKCPGCDKYTRFDRVKTRKSFQCSKCYHQIYPCARTIFHRSRTPLTIWFEVIYLFCCSKNAISAMEVQRQMGGTYKTSLRMLRQIRIMVSSYNQSFFSGSVEMDETFVGGKNINRHKDKKIKNSQGRACIDKTPVFGMFHRETGLIRCIVTKNTSRDEIQPHILGNVEPGSCIFTDEWSAYQKLDHIYTREFVNHRAQQYGDGENTTNRIENAWSGFKRGIKGTYIHVSRKHLQSYVDEFVFRFNNRNSEIPIFHQALKLVS